MTESSTQQQFDWKEAVRDRLEQGGEVCGSSFREEVGRRVHVYGFLEYLEKSEGWIFEKTVKRADGNGNPNSSMVVFWRLTGKGEPSGTALKPGESFVDVVTRRLLAGEEVSGQTIAAELGASRGVLTHAKNKLRAQGYEFVDRRDGHQRLTSLRSTKKPTPPPKAEQQPTQSKRKKKPVKFGVFEIR